MSASPSIKAGVIGATGYGGIELVRLLAQHPAVSLQVLVSRSQAGQKVVDIFPHLRSSSCDQLIYCAPQDADWSELNRQAIESADLIACPGCYPTAVQLGWMPLLQNGLLSDDTLIADAKSGISGAGRAAKTAMLFSERNDNFEAYASARHRHYPEIKQQLELMRGNAVSLIFTPHLLPATRGIYATLYARLSAPDTDVQAVFAAAYADEPFVSVLPPGEHPQTRSVAGSNQVQIGIARPPHSDYVTVMVAEDNLIKGAAGQAIQCMNIMFAQPETTGLQQLATV